VGGIARRLFDQGQGDQVSVDTLPQVRGKLTENAPLAPLVWFKSGGAAQWLFEPKDEEDLVDFLRQLDPEVPMMALGLGSNMIVRDAGVPGVVVRLGKSFSKIDRLDDVTLRCGGGASGILVSSTARDAGIAGMEFLRGIPGTVGGFVRMNGGAYGREVQDILIEARVALRDGSVETLPLEKLGYTYRHSELPDGAVVIEATFRGSPGRPEAIGAEMDAIARAREESQPLRSRTGGSTFKNPPGHKAWVLVDAAGCRGLTMGGNIGLPILLQDPLPEGGGYVLELSSYQIDLTQSLDCDVAVLLNITPDHLDRYDAFDAYKESKMRLFRMQSLNHVAVFTGEDQFGYDAYQDRWEGAHETTLLARCEDAFGQESWPTLQGPHNAQNAAAAIATCKALGIGEAQIEESLRTYPGLPHRMERVREKDGVLFVNDSKATNPTATAPALAAFPSIRWILGGRAKTDNLDECVPHFGHVRSAYTIGEAGEFFAKLLAAHMPVANCETLENALNRAAEDSQAGDTVLLSPACASFDQFKDFEQRGDRFRDLVGAL